MVLLSSIHQNPVKAKLCGRAEDYAYSSMQQYITHPALVTTDFALSMLPLDQFIDYHHEENEDHCLEMEETFRLTDEDVKMLIVKLAKCKNASEFQELDAPARNACIHKLHKKGASIRQISRLTGISKKIVERNI